MDSTEIYYYLCISSRTIRGTAAVYNTFPAPGDNMDSTMLPSARHPSLESMGRADTMPAPPMLITEVDDASEVAAMLQVFFSSSRLQF